MTLGIGEERLVGRDVAVGVEDQVALGVGLVAVVVRHGAPRVARDVLRVELLPDDALGQQARLGERLGLGVRLPGVGDHRLLGRRESRPAVGAVEHELVAGLAAVEHHLALRAVDLDVGEGRRVHVVHVPHVVVDRLVVPLVLAGRGIHRDHRAREQVVTRPQRAVLRRRAAARVAERHVVHAELGVDGAVHPGRRAALLGAVGAVGKHRPPRVAGVERHAVDVGEQLAALRSAEEVPQ